MTTSRAPSRANALVVLLGVMGLFVASAGPAAAQDEVVAGSGVGGGYEFAPTEGDPCGLETPDHGAYYPDDTFVLTHESTYDVFDDTGTRIASYEGPTTMTITIDEVVQAPQGAEPGAGCDAIPVVPFPVEIIDVVITGTSGGGSVDCAGNEGSYLRVSTTVVFEFVVECDITGNVAPYTGSVTDVQVQHVVEGNQTPCFPFACSDVDPDAPEDATSIMHTAFEAEAPPPPSP